MFSNSSSIFSTGRLAVFCACVGTVLCGCSSAPPVFDPAAETVKIDEAIAKVKADTKMTPERKKKALTALEGMRPTEPKKK